MLKVFAYLRVSGLTQVLGDGLDRQLEACQKYAHANGLEIVEVFREEGISGTTEIDGRVALPALFVALEQNGVRTVLIERLDRIARDLMVQETIIADMQKNGYTLISCYEPDLCSTDPSRVLMRQIFGAIAQYDKTMIVLKMKAGKDRKRVNDPTWKEGKKPFGEKPGEAATLALMHKIRANGGTLQSIVDTLNQAGTLARSGKPWTVGTVGKILSR